MISFLGDLGAPKVKQVAQVKPARPDPKVEQAKRQINQQINQVENLLATVPNSEYAQYLTCLRNRLNDISIVCNEPTTPIAKVRQMYAQAQAAAKKDASIAKRDDKRAVVEAKQAERKAETVAKKEARKQKRLGNGKVVAIEPKEEAAVNKIDSTIENQIRATDQQIAATKNKIAQVKSKIAAAKARGKKLNGIGNLQVGRFGMGGLGVMIGGKDIDCNKKKNAVICALSAEFASVSQSTYDQMTGLIQELVDKQSQLETLLAELTALIATLPTEDQIRETVSTTILDTMPPPIDAAEIGDAVSTAITGALTTIQNQAPVGGGGYYIDPTSGQPFYPTMPQTPMLPDVPTQAVDDTAFFDFGGQEIVPSASQPSFYSEPNTGRATVFLDTETSTPVDSNLGPLPNMQDLLNDFGDDYYQRDEYNEGLFGLGCGGKKSCGCGC